MKDIGLFEAKTRFSEICDEVSRLKQPVVVTRRGKALVRIDPIEAKEESQIWDLSQRFRRASGAIREDILLPKRKVERRTNPLG